MQEQAARPKTLQTEHNKMQAREVKTLVGVRIPKRTLCQWSEYTRLEQAEQQKQPALLKAAQVQQALPYFRTTDHAHSC